MFNVAASHARNYHNWHWDVTDPDKIPRFDDMGKDKTTHFGDLPGHDSALAQDW
jgi:hypothetical protein